jgi:hypothetical protein
MFVREKVTLRDRFDEGQVEEQLQEKKQQALVDSDFGFSLLENSNSAVFLSLCFFPKFKESSIGLETHPQSAREERWCISYACHSKLS